MDFNSDPNGWAIALAVIGFGCLALEQVRYFLKSGVAITRGDRAHRREEDTANYWTIVGLYALVGALFAAVGLWLVGRLIARGVPMVWWTPVSIVWALGILAAHQSIWNSDTSRPPRFERAASIFTAISHGLLLLGMIAFVATALAFRNSPKSPAATATMAVEVHDHGVWYVTPHAANLSHTSEFLLLFMTFPWLATGVSMGWLHYKERRIKRGDRG